MNNDKGIIVFEHKKQPLLSAEEFRRRLLRSFLISTLMIAFSLGIGIIGYKLSEDMAWIDALLNASMILGGMGPVNALQTTTGKVFASFYALFSGIVFISSAGVLVAPIFHRIIHTFHADIEEVEE